MFNQFGVDPSICDDSAGGGTFRGRRTGKDGAHLRVLKAAASSHGETELTAYVTGYSDWDNTPPDSAAIALPIVHSSAGGKGSYSDPITLAVGHSPQGADKPLTCPPARTFILKHVSRKWARFRDKDMLKIKNLKQVA